MLRDIVLEVQQHKHTLTCKKKNTICRFDFPKPVSEKTILATPIDEQYPKMSEDEKKEKLEKYKNILSKAKEILSDEKLDTSMSYNQFYQKIECSKKEYEEALSTTVRGNVLILKRNVNEVWTNNYNPNWLKAWNANIDFQLAHDPYAILTYICSYVGKDESGMTQWLKDALRATKHLAREEQLKALKTAWLTHRQIGASETIVRLMPGFHLTESNIGCVWVATGYPENRSSFFKKISDKNLKKKDKVEIDIDTVLEQVLDYYSENEDELDEENNAEEEAAHTENIKLADRQGTFRQAITVHERYAKRPKRLQKMCLAQFSTLYIPASKIKKDTIFDDDDCSELLSEHKLYGEDDNENSNFLPKYIDLRKFKLGFMRIRSFPAVLRMHSSKKKEGLEEFYAELQLYYPWRLEEKDLHRESSDKFYNENEQRKIIEMNKKGLFPQEDIIEMCEHYFDNDGADRPAHILDILDSQRIQDDEDDELEGIIDDPEYVGRDPDGFKVPETKINFESGKYKVLSLPDDPDELLEMARKLAPEQLQALSKVIGHCKAIKRNLKNSDHDFEPLRLIIHGGSGSGKSFVLKCASFFAEKLLRKAGGLIDKPRVLICAPTGMAAKLVNGATLHSVFDFKFGNEHMGLSDKKLNDARDLLSELQLVIIDELSMMSSDLLYKLHLRLCEIYQTEEKFANIGIVLVGDVLQLAPIKGKYIFEQPKNPHFAPFFEVDSLWHSFEVIDLKENHRQGDALTFSKVLNKMRYGIVDNEVEELLTSRLLDKQTKKNKLRKKKKKIPNTSDATVEDLSVTHVNYTNEEVCSHNTKMLNILPDNLVEIPAKIPGKFKPRITDHGTIGDKQFMENLKIKIGARVMLVHNIDTIDGLVNGELGHVIGIEQKDNNVHYVIVRFDDQESGAKQKQKFPGLSTKYASQNGIPIARTEIDFQFSSKSGTSHALRSKIKQFPLRLAWAITCHKMQGQTVKKGSKLIVHWSTQLKDGMAYVM